MAGYYSFANWAPVDIDAFERHYGLALAKSQKQEAKLISDFDAMKSIMVKYAAAGKQTLPLHLTPDRDQSTTRDSIRIHIIT